VRAHGDPIKLTSCIFIYPCDAVPALNMQWPVSLCLSVTRRNSVKMAERVEVHGFRFGTEVYNCVLNEFGYPQ